MTKMLTTTVLSATIIATVFTANPAAGSDWFGVEISNHGIALGFGSSNWGLWGSSWSDGGWSTDYSTALSGYGEWVWVGGLGRVWRPWVATGWRPFTHGRWVWTSMGWTWVAYEPWGWAPHHYGQWAFTTVGWVWTPGYTYHPGNVIWVGSGSYVGWYPCAPHGWSHARRAFHDGWSSGYAHGRHDGYGQGYADGWRDARYATWVEWSHVGADNLSHHAVGHDRATRGMARARVEGFRVPPSRTEVERRVGHVVPEARIVERHATIGGREVRVVRPEGQARSVERHADDTVRRALAPAAQNRVAATSHRSPRAESATAAPSSRSSGPSGSSASAGHRDRAARPSETPFDRGARPAPAAGDRSRTRATASSAATRPEHVGRGREVTKPSVASRPAREVTAAPDRGRESNDRRRETAPVASRSPESGSSTSGAPTTRTPASKRRSADQPATAGATAPAESQRDTTKKPAARPARRTPTRVKS